MTNSAKLSISFSIGAAFLLAVGAAAVLLIGHINGVLDDVGFYNLQIKQAAEAMTALRLQPENARENLARIEDLKRCARTELELKEIAEARLALEQHAPPAQAIVHLEQLSEYYRKATAAAHEQLVVIHQRAVQGAIFLMGGGTVLLVGIMLLVRRWFFEPVFDAFEAIQRAIEDNPARPVPKNEMGQLVAPVRELAVRAKQLEDRATRAERLATVGEACTRVGQNLRNLIHATRTTAQSERGAKNADPRAAFDYIISTSNVMDRWVTSLINSSRPLELRACRQPIEPIIHDSVSLLNPLLAERQITVAFQPAESLPDVNLDRPLFEQALVAVLKNAMDASPDEGRILITTTNVPANMVGITIADEGEGMSEEVRRRAFDAFFTSRKDGVGLGLTYVQQIVVLHGGTIALESDPPKGARVHIQLPAATDANGPGKTDPAATTRPSSKSALAASTRR